MMLRRVEGGSMLPGLKPGSVVLAVRRAPKVGEVVIAKQARREIIKRVHAATDKGFELRGDNASESVDSREFGPVAKADILGVVMITLPVATEPPKTRQALGVPLGWVCAIAMIVMALIHLFRIDTWLPLLNGALPGGMMTASLVGALIVIFEVLAVPFLLRMKLSPLMRVVSGFAVALVPLAWLLIAIWGLGFSYSTTQLASFISTPSSWWLILFNAVWLGFNLWVLRELGYDKAAEALRKRR